MNENEETPGMPDPVESMKEAVAEQQAENVPDAIKDDIAQREEGAAVEGLEEP